MTAFARSRSGLWQPKIPGVGMVEQMFLSMVNQLRTGQKLQVIGNPGIEIYPKGGAVVVPWYLAGGTSIANVIAAHQPLGAASLAASYDDIAHVATTWNAAPGSAPTFDASYGWLFDSSDVLNVGSGAIASAVPLTMLCLFNPTNNTTDSILIRIRDGTNANSFSMVAYGSGGPDPCLIITRASSSNAQALSTTFYTAGIWYVFAGVFAATNSRSAYLNGAGKATNTTDKTPAGLNTTVIGTAAGKIAADAWYDIALSDAQVLAVSNALLALVT